MPASRWDTFALGELSSLAEGLEAGYHSTGVVDVPLLDELLVVMEARGAGTEERRDELRGSLKKARMRITEVDPQMPRGHRKRS